jgi:tRNA (adenine22-N1)-methyltransferase
MIKAKLDGRLLSASKFVRQGAIFADVGTDHAHLPIFLLKTGKIERAILSDINEGPLLSARKNIIEAGLSDKAELVLCDGCAALSQKGITDVAICGMGGELIASIIDNADFLFEKKINLILGPMTRQEYLRGYLISSGFEIISEDYSLDNRKHYVTMLACFSGNKRTPTDGEIYLGTLINKTRDKLSREELIYLTKKREALNKRLLGIGREGALLEEKIINLIDEILK